MPWLHTKTNDNLSTICLHFVYNLSSICPNFVLVLSEFCHNKNKTKQRQMTNCIQIVDNLSFVFVLSCFCIQFVICLYFVLFLLWQNSDKTEEKLRQIVDKMSPNCRQIVDKLSFVFVCSQGISFKNVFRKSPETRTRRVARVTCVHGSCVGRELVGYSVWAYGKPWLC